MNYNGRRLNLAMVGLLVASVGCAAWGPCHKNGGHNRHTLYSDGVIEDVRMDTASMELVRAVNACSTMADLKGAIPAIARHLQKMARSNDVDGLMQAHGAIGDRFHSIAAATTTGKYTFWREDLAILRDELDSASSKNERLAWLFLSLPNLFWRAPSAGMDAVLDDGMRGLSGSRRNAEKEFMASLGTCMPQMAKEVGTYWYKGDGSIPTEADMRAFFAYFCAVF
ncbi:MAG: hypothetical protein PHV13_05050 [Candidatus ainarchaeum sp.]|nr:hypothetical protein [Candidatus ainarchaeum sp.]